MRFTAGTIIDDRYEIVELLGQGRSGIVYSAHDRQLTRKVAIKVINLALLQDKDFIVRFMREARILASIDHVNIVRCFDLVLESKNGSYLVTELVDGASLAEILEQHGRLAIGDAIDIGIQICEGAEFLSQKQLVHRDIKPSNIMVDTTNPSMPVKIIDFGLVGFGQLIEGVEQFKITKPDVVMGTPAFMSPEQIRGQALDHRSDIYSIGCVLFELITGEKVASAETVLETMVIQLTRKPKSLATFFENSDFPIDDVEQVLTRALDKDPAHRYQNASELKDALAPIRDKISLGVAPSKCRICGRPRREQVANSSITGWIFSCSCEQIIPTQSTTRFCDVCGKAVEERPAGSLTQWLFKSNRCSCGVKQAVHELGGDRQNSTTAPKLRVNQSSDGDNDNADDDRLDSNITRHTDSNTDLDEESQIDSTSMLFEPPRSNSRLTIALLIVCTLIGIAAFFKLLPQPAKKQTTPQLHRITLKNYEPVNEFFSEFEKPPFRLYINETGQWEAQGLEVNDAELAKLKTQVEQFEPILQARKVNKIITGKIKVNSAVMNGSGLEYLKDLNVTSIDLSNSSVSDQGLETLKNFPILTFLSIRKADKITPLIITTLSELPQLKTLRISGRGITRDVLPPLSKLQKLEDLSIGELTIGGADIDALSQSKNLQFIEFESCVLDLPAYTKLANWKNLKGVKFKNPKLSKAHLEGYRLLTRSGKL